MPLQKLQDYILESWLPTKLSILIAGSSISLAALSIGLPEFLQTITGYPLQQEKTLLLRIAMPLVILFLGTLIVLLLVMRHYKLNNILQVSQHEKDKTENEIIITEIHKRVLEMLFQKPSTIENICKTLKLNKEESTYYLFDLYKHNMVSRPVPYSSGPEEWRICQDGREYVMSNQQSA